MKQSVNQNDFHDAFLNMGRGDQFSYAARNALFEYLEELEQDIGEEIELDVIALCCDYSEHEDAVECIKDMGYNFDLEDFNNEEEKVEAAQDYLMENTIVIVFDEGIIIQGF